MGGVRYDRSNGHSGVWPERHERKEKCVGRNEGEIVDVEMEDREGLPRSREKLAYSELGQRVKQQRTMNNSDNRRLSSFTGCSEQANHRKFSREPFSIMKSQIFYSSTSYLTIKAISWRELM